jgi:hypothetical protein
MITEPDIRAIIDEMKVADRSGAWAGTDLSFRCKQPNVIRFVEKMPKSYWNKSERLTLRDFASLLYLIFQNEYGVVIPVIPFDLLEKEYKRCSALDPFNDYLTECDLVEDYLKPIVHANVYVKPRLAKEFVFIVCAILNCFYLVTQKLTPLN